jgi:hypothetical protein
VPETESTTQDDRMENKPRGLMFDQPKMTTLVDRKDCEGGVIVNGRGMGCLRPSSSQFGNFRCVEPRMGRWGDREVSDEGGRHRHPTR